jgi:ELWxxDGT repeat protein
VPVPRPSALTAAFALFIFVVASFTFEATARAALGPVVVEQVKDIRPGPGDGDPMQGGDGQFFPGGVDLDGVLVFDADSGTVVAEGGLAGRELWRSDGTEAGTYLIKDIFPGNNGVFAFSSDPSYLTEMNGEVFFQAQSNTAVGRELWKTDGTEAGTVLVKDINPAGFNSGSPADLVKVNGTLFFTANSDFPSDSTFELWKSDGTTAGTELVYDLQGCPTCDISNMQAIGDQLYFSFDDGVHGRELWTSDGSFFGTKMVKDINPGPDDSKPGALLEYNGLLYFKANDGVVGIELWRTDGTPGGTELFADLRPGGDDSNGVEFGGPALEFGGELFVTGDFGLYKTNGIPGDVEEMFGGIGAVGGLIEANGSLYITIPASGPLFSWDGTAGGTELVPGGTLPPFAATTTFGGNFYGAFDDGTLGTELWRSDLTTIGTERLTDINPGNGGSLINEMVVSGEYLYFRGADAEVLSGAGATGVELWAAHIDETAPETTVNSGPALGRLVNSNSVTFRFSSNEPDSRFNCSLDGGAPQPCNSGTRTYRGLAVGAHTFSVAAVDPAPFNNVDPTPATRSFRMAERVAPRLRVRGARLQRNSRKIVLGATCLNEACVLRAGGFIRVKVLRPNGRVRTTRTLRLRGTARRAGKGRQVKLTLRFTGATSRLVRRVIRKRASTATIAVRATDTARNTSRVKRKVNVLNKRRR